MSYDCTDDVAKHQSAVNDFVNHFVNELLQRARVHDESKLQDPEKAVFDEWTPNLKKVEFGSQEYKDALKEMGKGLEHHYKTNRHHPEHFDAGILDMNLIDVVEMLCDWIAATKAKGNKVDLGIMAKRFGIDDQLLYILGNTLKEVFDDA